MANSKTFLFLILLWFINSSAQASNSVWLIDITGAIGPATADHMIRGIEQAQQAQAQFVVLKVDTPGGLDSAMRQMIKAILASDIPIVAYVAPGGARAASAGTYLLYASHIAAMAPATNMGAATPVKIGAPSLPSLPEDNERDKKPDKDFTPATAMERKIINDAVAYIQSLADLRGRNADWAVRAVREGVSLPAEQALSLKVIDIVAGDMNDLLSQLNGRTVRVSNEERVLNTARAEVYHHLIDWRSEFLSVITDPNIAYMLMLVGIYGLIFEFSNPGLGLPGILGAVCIFVALYAFQVLPVSYAGLALIMLGVALMAAEAFAPSFGVLGIGGIASFVIGSVILMDTELPGYQIAMPMIVAFAAFSAGLLIFALGLVAKARKQVVVTGMQHLVGNVAVVEMQHDGEPLVRLDGELWRVNCDLPLSVGDKVTVTSPEGVVLRVTKIKGES